jgi:hypothetical protein
VPQFRLQYTAIFETRRYSYNLTCDVLMLLTVVEVLHIVAWGLHGSRSNRHYLWLDCCFSASIHLCARISILSDGDQGCTVRFDGKHHLRTFATPECPNTGTYCSARAQFVTDISIKFRKMPATDCDPHCTRPKRPEQFVLVSRQ